MDRNKDLSNFHRVQFVMARSHKTGDFVCRIENNELKLSKKLSRAEGTAELDDISLRILLDD